MPEKKTYVVNGVTYDIPEEKAGSFLERYPDAEERQSFIVDNDTFDIPIAKVDDFLLSKPNAQPTFDKKKETSPMFSPSGAESISDVFEQGRPRKDGEDITVNDYLSSRGVNEREAQHPDFKEMFTRTQAPLEPGQQTLSDEEVNASDTILENMRVGRSVREGRIEDVPVIQAWVDKYPFIAPLVNFEQAVGREANRIVFKTLGGAQKMFYKGVGALMETSKIPDVKAKGLELQAQQDESRNWFQRAEDYVEKSFDENWPEPQRDDMFSSLVYGLGSVVPLMGTMAITPQASIAGLNMQLPINLGAQGLTQTYEQTGKLGESIKEGVLSAGEGALIMGLGYGGEKAGKYVIDKVIGRVGPRIAGTLGGVTTAATMAGGGMAHDATQQVIESMESGEPLMFDKKRMTDAGALWFAFGVNGIVKNATNVYMKAPKEAVNMARGLKVDTETLRERAIEMEVDAFRETDPQKQHEMLVTASSMHKFADIKGTGEMVGRDPAEAIKSIRQSDMSESDKIYQIEKINEDALHQESLRLTEELSTAGDKLRAESKKETSETPKSKGEGKVSKEGESGSKEGSGMSVSAEETVSGKEMKKPEGADIMQEGMVDDAVKTKREAEKVDKGEKKPVVEPDVGKDIKGAPEVGKAKETLKENEARIEEIKSESEDLTKRIEVEEDAAVKDRLRVEKQNLAKEKRSVERAIKKQQDATKEPSTEEVPMGEQPEVSKKDGKEDAKAPKEEAPKKERSIAEDTAKDFVLSDKPERVNKKAEGVKQKFDEYKDDRVKQEKVLSDFIKANQAKLTESGISPANVKKLMKAKTWTQVGRAIQRVTKAMEKPTPKMRSAAMTDFIEGNKGLFKGLNQRTYDSMLKRVAEASVSDAKLDNARSYIEKILGDKEFREAESRKGKAIEDILKVTSARAVLDKGARGGKKRSVKKGLKTEDGKITDRLLEIGEFVEKGRSEKTKDPMAEMERIDGEIEQLENIASEENIRRIEELKERQIELSFAEVGKMSSEQIEGLRDFAKDLNKDGRAQAKAELQKRIDEYKRLTDIANEEITGGKEVKFKPRIQKQTKATDFWSDTSFPSLLSKLAKKGEDTGGGRVFSDKLNKELTDKIVIPAETQKALLESRHMEEMGDAMVDAFGSKIKAKNKMIDANKEKGTDAYFINEKGKKVELVFTERQALEKVLQSRDPVLLEDLLRPLEEGGNGYTPETLTQLEKFISPELKKFGDWMYENQKVWGKEVYNPVYKKLEGIDIANFDVGYWPSQKSRVSPYAERGLDPSGNKNILQSRTIRRTGVKAPIKDTDAFSTYMQYIQEATRYNSWAEGHKKLSYVLRNPKVAENIRQTHGSRAYENVNFFLDKFAGESNRVSLDVLDYITNATGQGILALKSMVGFKQVLSSMYYAQDMPGLKLAEGTAKSMKPGTVEHAVSKWINEDPFVKARRDAFLQRDAASSEFFGMAHGDSKIMNKVKDTFSKARVGIGVVGEPIKKVQNYFIRIGDKAPITKSGAAYLTHKYKEYSGKRLTKDVLQKHISGEKVDKSIDKAKEDWLMMSSMTQQSVRESNISKVRSSGSLARAATQFTSGQAQIWRVTQDNVRKFNKAVKSGNVAERNKAAKNIMLTHMISGLAFGLANNKFKVKGNEIDLLLSVAMGNMAGIAFLGRGAMWIKDLITGKPWADATLTNIPSVGLVSEAGEYAQRIMKEREKDNPDEEKLRKYSSEILKNILTINGVGVEGGEKIVKGYIELFSGESEYPINDILGIGDPYTPKDTKGDKNE